MQPYLRGGYKKGSLAGSPFLIDQSPPCFSRCLGRFGVLCHESLTELESGQHNPPNVRGLIA